MFISLETSNRQCCCCCCCCCCTAEGKSKVRPSFPRGNLKTPPKTKIVAPKKTETTTTKTKKRRFFSFFLHFFIVKIDTQFTHKTEKKRASERKVFFKKRGSFQRLSFQFKSTSNEVDRFDANASLRSHLLAKLTSI